LIDQAKVENKETKKQFESYRKNSGQALIRTKDKLANLQQNQLEQTAQIKDGLKQIEQFKKDKRELTAENHKLRKTIATFEKQLNKNMRIKSRKSKNLDKKTGSHKDVSFFVAQNSH